MSLGTTLIPTVSSFTGRDTQLADSASFYCAPNIAGTPIVGHAAPTTFDETKALLYIYNGAASAISVYPTALLLKLTTAGTNSTNVRFEQTISAGNRLVSGGTTLVIAGTSGQATPAGVVATFGAAVLTAAALSTRNLLGGRQYRTVIGVVKDQYGFQWGAGNADLFQMPQAVTDGAAELDLIHNYAPVAIPTGWGFAIHQWSASQTVAMAFDPVSLEMIIK